MLERLTTQLQTWFAGLDGAARNRLFAGLAVAVLAVAGTGWFATRTRWAPLFSAPHALEELLDAAAALDAAGVPSKIESNNLLVADRDLGKARTALTATAIGPSLEDVTKLPMGLTPTAQSWAFLHSREGDLSRMINQIDGIAASSVYLVPRETSLYIGDDRPASASVMLRLEPGVAMSGGQVKAVVNLVANAVDGLDPDRVTLADDRGNLLAEGEPGSEGNDDTQLLLSYRRELEHDAEKSVSRALSPVLGGPSAFTVTATVDVDLTARDVSTRQIDVAKQATISEVTDEQNDEKRSAAGAPGVDSNLPERAPGAAGTPGSSSVKTAATVNYIYPTVDETTHVIAGTITRKSLAVQIDLNKVAELAGPDAEKIRSQLVDSVKAAVGYSEARDDLVTVTFVPFAAPTLIEAEVPSIALTEVATTGFPWALAAIALALVFWFVVRPLIAVATGTNRAVTAAADAPVDVPLADKDEDADLAARLRNVVESFNPVAADDLNRLVERESVQAAAVLRKWTARR